MIAAHARSSERESDDLTEVSASKQRFVTHFVWADERRADEDALIEFY